jgi:hypothetical protein
MPLLAAEMRHVDSSHGIAGQDLEDGASGHGREPLARFQDGQGAEKPHGIQNFIDLIIAHGASIAGAGSARETFMPIFSKAPFAGKVAALYLGHDRETGLEKPGVTRLELTYEGIAGDFHAGLTRKSDSRTLQLYKRGLDIRNTRQLSLVSDTELAEIAECMGLPAVDAKWVGANALVTGIPDLTLLPPSTRLQFPSGATIVVDLENVPCRQVAEVIERHHPKPKLGFVAAAKNKRGVTAWVEREGAIELGDDIAVLTPPNRLYAHA